MRDLRAPAVLVAALVLSGCGFHPLYAVPGAARGSMKQDLGSIYVEPVPDRLGYDLRNTVIDLIDGRAEPAGATYSLRMTLGLKNEPIGVQSQIVGSGATAITQTVITRYNDTLTVSYDLIDRKTNTVIAHGIETDLSSYNVLASPYATLVDQQDADQRAADEIADRLRIDLAAYFARGAQK
jgi:LPS-assembly lipoprotein